MIIDQLFIIYVYYLLFVSDYWKNVNLSGYVMKYKNKKGNRSFHDGEILNLLLIFTWQNKHYVDSGMVFKQSFKYLKNEKIYFIQVILKLECLSYQKIYIFSSNFIFVEPFWLKQIQKMV